MTRRRFGQGLLAAAVSSAIRPSWGRNPRGSLLVPSPGFQYKWNPGDYMGSNGQNGAVTAEMDLLATGASTATGVLGYIYNVKWPSAESTQGDITAFAATVQTAYNYLKSKNPLAKFGFRVLSDYGATIPVSGFSSHVFSNQIVPNYILNCGGTLNVYNTVSYPVSSGATTAYTLPAQQNSQYGFGLAFYDGSANYGGAIGALWQPGVRAAFANFLAQCAKIPLGGIPMDLNPDVEMMGLSGEVSYNFNQGSIKPVGTGTNACTVTNFWTQYNLLARSMTAAWPHTMFGFNATYGVTGADGSADGPDSFSTATGHLSAAELGSVQGLMMMTSDTFGASWTLHYNQNLGSQAANSIQSFIGVVPTQFAGNTEVIPYPPVNSSLQGVMPICAQVQSPDYQQRMYATAGTPSSGFYNNAGGVTQILQAANGAPPVGAGLDARYQYGASHRLWCPASLTDNDIADFGAYMQPTFSGTAGTVTYPVNTVRPSNLP